MADALAKVKKDLGKDAVILHTRTLTRGGILGIGARSVIEITATADERVMSIRRAARSGAESDELPSPRSSPRVAPLFDYAVAQSVGASAPREGLRGLPTPVLAGVTTDPGAGSGSARRAEAVNATRGASGASDPGAGVGDDKDADELRRELTEIRGMVRDLVRHVRGSDEFGEVGAFDEYHALLLAQELDAESAYDLLGRTAERLRCQSAFQGRIRADGAGGAEFSRESVLAELRKTIAESLPTAAPLRLRDDGQTTVVALVGPTGVGKTTTIAKLAANMKLRENKRVGLITIDSYRIAAVEQLKTYAQILRVPIASVLKPEDIRTAIDEMSDMDLILIDTAGRSQKDGLRIGELNEFVRAANPDQIHLVLSTTSKEKTLREAIDRFSVLGSAQLLFTKVDEADGFGVILNVLRDVDMRPSYLTTGQAVPDDIEIASASRLARLIVDQMEIQSREAGGLRPEDGGRTGAVA